MYKYTTHITVTTSTTIKTNQFAFSFKLEVDGLKRQIEEVECTLLKKKNKKSGIVVWNGKKNSEAYTK